MSLSTSSKTVTNRGKLKKGVKVFFVDKWPNDQYTALWDSEVQYSNNIVKDLIWSINLSRLLATHVVKTEISKSQGTRLTVRIMNQNRNPKLTLTPRVTIKPQQKPKLKELKHHQT